LSKAFTVIFDTSMLMSCFEKPVDVIGRVEELLEAKINPAILRSQLAELEGLAKSTRSKASRIARAVLELVEEKFAIIDDPGGKPVDDLIVEEASQRGFMVATNDVELRRRLRRLGVAVVYLRRDGKLEVEGLQP